MRLINRIVVVVDVRTVRIGTEEQPRVRVVPPAVHIVQVQRVQAQIHPRAVPAVIIPRGERGRGPRTRIAPRVIRPPTPTTTPIQRDVCYRIAVPVVLDVVRVVAINVLQIAARACHLHAAGTAVGVPVAHPIKHCAADGSTRFRGRVSWRYFGCAFSKKSGDCIVMRPPFDIYNPLLMFGLNPLPSE